MLQGSASFVVIVPLLLTELTEEAKVGELITASLQKRARKHSRIIN